MVARKGRRRPGRTPPRFAKDTFANGSYVGHEALGFDRSPAPRAAVLDSDFEPAAGNALTVPAVAIAVAEPPKPPKPGEGSPSTAKPNGTVLHDCAGIGAVSAICPRAADRFAAAAAVRASSMAAIGCFAHDVCADGVHGAEARPVAREGNGRHARSRTTTTPHLYAPHDRRRPQWAAGAPCSKESGFMVTSTQIRLEHDQVLDAAEQMLQAQRRLGALLARAPFRRGGRPGSLPSQDVRDFLTLAEVGLARHRSSKYQRLAKIDDRRFEKYLAEVRAAGLPASIAGALRAAQATGRRSSRGQTRAEVTTRISLAFQRHLRAALKAAAGFGLTEQAQGLRSCERFAEQLERLIKTDNVGRRVGHGSEGASR
jgi:hypothetical protein